MRYTENSGADKKTQAAETSAAADSAGRIVHHVDLSKEVKSLQKKIAEGRNDVSEELAALRKMEEEQLVCFDDDIRYMTQAVDTLTAGLKKAKEVLDF